MYYSSRKIFLSLLFLINGVIFADKIAVTTKVKGMAEIMKVGKKEFNNLKAGSILDDGDKIRTGKSGFVAIIFIDDKSTLKIKENSEAVITGRRTAKDISKKINMDGGTIRASITKQNVDFVIQTPTSVASVKGTDFWMLVDELLGDKVIDAPMMFPTRKKEIEALTTLIDADIIGCDDPEAMFGEKSNEVLKKLLNGAPKKYRTLKIAKNPFIQDKSFATKFEDEYKT